MAKRLKSNLKQIIDTRKISIRQLASMSTEKYGKDNDLKFETLRRLYNDETKHYQRDTIIKLCEILNINISDLFSLIDKDSE